MKMKNENIIKIYIKIMRFDVNDKFKFNWSDKFEFIYFLNNIKIKILKLLKNEILIYFFIILFQIKLKEIKIEDWIEN